MEMLEVKQQQQGKSLGVGLDSELKKIPLRMHVKDVDGKLDVRKTMFNFNASVIDDTHDIVGAYLINPWFYLAKSQEALTDTIAMIHITAPDVPIFLNTGVGDIGNSNLAIIEYAFNKLDFDGIMLNPWFGGEAMQPFLDQKQKGFVVACRTSNPGSDQFQCLEIKNHVEVPLYKTVAWEVSKTWNNNRNCALQFGVNCCQEVRSVREIVPDMPIFIQGVGPQSKTGFIEDDDVRDIMSAGIHKTILCSARGVIFSSSPRKAATRLHHLLSEHRMR
jgi:orotidine-5'-phosphate decarboxylase